MPKRKLDTEFNQKYIYLRTNKYMGHNPRVKVETLGQTRVQLYTLGQLLGPSDFGVLLVKGIKE